MILLERAGYQTVGFDRRNFMIKPQPKITKMLNICADIAGGGLQVAVLRAESGDDLHLPTAHPSDRMSEGARDTARMINGRRAFVMLSRGPPQRGSRRRVTLTLSPLSVLLGA